ncbi:MULTISPECIES: FMN-binding negative transcriptional regulator [unclassified Pseudoalteromonas]|uniref:FMN-binding negative transcriptional regulator n=1 Tax=unclassified Pseudoalteromonas TaxID=194690 RepID=UPI0005A9A242|nr:MULTISPECIES: FMN-binding negative transcriptional regulator [unclassified Pseudoalteromonas]
MYPPKYYQTNSEDKIEQGKLIELVTNNPLATLIINRERELPHVSHIPFHFDDNQTSLVGHTSNQHPLTKRLKQNLVEDIILIFHGEQGYISPNYSEGQPVPTWNYSKVQIIGKAKIITDSNEKYKQMDITTQYFEKEQTQPWLLDSAPSKAIEQMLKAITIFKVSIDEINGQFKLSQNKSTAVKQQISNQLKLKGNQKLAEQMLD